MQSHRIWASPYSPVAWRESAAVICLMADTAADLGRRAESARTLAKATHDKLASASLGALAADLTEQARVMEAQAQELATRAEITRQHAAEAQATARKIRERLDAAKKRRLTPSQD